MLKQQLTTIKHIDPRVGPEIGELLLIGGIPVGEQNRPVSDRVLSAGRGSVLAHESTRSGRAQVAWE